MTEASGTINLGRHILDYKSNNLKHGASSTYKVMNYREPEFLVVTPSKQANPQIYLKSSQNTIDVIDKQRLRGVCRLNTPEAAKCLYNMPSTN